MDEANGKIEDRYRRTFGTCMFSDLCGSTALGASIEPELLAAIVTQIKDILVRRIEEHSGTVTQFQGDGVLAVFGFPTPTESSVKDAVDAALAAHQDIRAIADREALKAKRSFRLHTGVHSGLFLAGSGGDIEGRFELFGDTVNVAAHLCSRANEDQILVSSHAMAGVRSFFDTAPVLPVKVKGKDELLDAVHVTARTDVKRAFDARRAHGLVKLIGRTNEMETLHRLTAEASDRVVCLLGEPGVGKTRLAEEFFTTAVAQGALVAKGYCGKGAAASPLQPIRQILQDLLRTPITGDRHNLKKRIAARMLALDARLLDHAETCLFILQHGVASAEKTVPATKIAAAVVHLCKAIAETRKVILSIDDWHWIDDASRRVIVEMLLSDESSCPSIIVTSRHSEIDDPILSRAAQIPIETFTFAQTVQAVRSMISLPGNDRMLVRIFEQTGGNPLYLEEVCHLLSNDAGRSVLQDNALEGSASLSGLIETRHSRLKDVERNLVTAASVLGNVVDLDLLHQITGQEIFETTVQSLIGTGFFRDSYKATHLQFKHGITRDVIYQSLTVSRRAALHDAAATAIKLADSSDRSIELLAHHYAGAGRHSLAVKYGERAGDLAMAALSLDRARDFSLVALNALDKMENSDDTKEAFVRICDRFSIPYIYAPTHEHVSTLQRGIDYAADLGDAPGVTNLTRWLGYVQYVVGNQPVAIRMLERALAGARLLEDSVFEAQVKANLGQAYGAACDYEQALQFLDDAISYKRSMLSPTGEIDVGGAYALAARSLVYSDLGRFEEAEADVQAALKQFRGEGHVIEASIRNVYCKGLIWRGDFQHVLVEAKRARLVAERAGATFVLASAISTIGYAECKCGDVEAGLQKMRQANELRERRRLNLFGSMFHGWFADVLFEVGEGNAAMEKAQKAVDRAAEADHFGAALGHRILAKVAAKNGGSDTPTVQSHLRASLSSAELRRAPHELSATKGLILQIAPSMVS